jgi:hypothetical protein
MVLVYRGRVALLRPEGPVVLMPVDPEGAEELWSVLHSTWCDKMTARGWLIYTVHRNSSTMAAEAVDPKAPLPGLVTPQDREQWLDNLRQQHGEAWLQENWARLQEEWEYICRTF